MSVNHPRFIAAAFVVCLAVAPLTAAVAAPVPTLYGSASSAWSGRILIDAARHGEAYYVNPATDRKVYLGRPEQALERLTARAEYVGSQTIEQIGIGGVANEDDAIAAQYAGHVIAPRDLVGAAWYVHPTLQTRLRLATAQDAWEVLRSGEPTTAGVLASLSDDADPQLAPSGEQTVRRIVSGNELELSDGTVIRLDGTDVPANPELQSAAMSRLSEVAVGQSVRLESDVRDVDAAGEKLRYAWAGEVLLNLDLVRLGLAFHDITPPNFRHAEQLIVGSLDAQRHVYGFWRK